MTTDDLSTPLGQTKSKQRTFALPTLVPRVIAGALALCVGVFVVFMLVVDDPFGGEPMAVVATGAKAPAKAKAGDPDAHASAQPRPEGNGAVPAAAAGENPAVSGNTVTIIDGMSGKRQEVVIGAGIESHNMGSPSGSTDPARGTSPSHSPDVGPAAAFDPHLVEATRHGPIPRMGPDGTRAADVYARPEKLASGKSSPRIAIVVEGVGIGASGTSEALGKLPAAITLAFSPYGTDIERWANRARGEGHEILMQLPMEPLDYPENDPGPQTLLTSMPAEQNLDRLHWFMSRFQGYVGVANYMGARFTASEPSASPVLADIARRGLIYFDDGTSSRSLAGQLSGASNGAFARADIVLDAVPTGTEVDNALTRLEELARERGVAIGVAAALPIAINRIAQWAKAAESRGFLLVAISAVVNKPKST